MGVKRNHKANTALSVAKREYAQSCAVLAWLKSQNYSVNRKRVRRLMRVMGLKAIYRRPRNSKPALGHKIYPYLLGGMKITRPNQVWAADITIPMAHGFLYLVAIID